jgi:hypothetical protein
LPQYAPEKMLLSQAIAIAAEEDIMHLPAFASFRQGVFEMMFLFSFLQLRAI